MKYNVEKLIWTRQSYWDWIVVTEHKYYICAVWSFLNKGETCRIVKIEQEQIKK